MKSTCIAAALAAFAALPALAQTAAEDAARIEVLIGLEQAAKRGGAIAPAAHAATASPAAASTAASASPEAADPAAGRAQAATVAVPAPGDPATGAPEFAHAAAGPDEPALVYENPDAQPADPNVIALDALDRHVGESVRVRSHGGRTRVGTIESVGTQGVTLKSPMGGGYARYTLPYSQITRVEKR